jgi:hypothetical protein
MDTNQTRLSGYLVAALFQNEFSLVKTQKSPLGEGNSSRHLVSKKLSTSLDRMSNVSAATPLGARLL